MSLNVVDYAPLPQLPSEFHVVDEEGRLERPDPEGRGYTQITRRWTLEAARFNGADRKTSSVLIVGMHVVIGPDHQNGLYAELHDHADIGELTLCADVVTIRGRLHLPQTAVSIYARRLQFEGDEARLDTTPLSVLKADDKEQSDDGATAGTVRLYIGKQGFVTESAGPTRFVLRGADGQPGRAGKPGARDSDADMATYPVDSVRPYYDGEWKLRDYEGQIVKKAELDDLARRAVYVEYYEGDWTTEHSLTNLRPVPLTRIVTKPDGTQYSRGTGNTPSWGVKRWPTNGHPAIAPGRPGRGGNGGVLETTIDGMGPCVDLSGGAPGSPGFKAKGGLAGKPEDAVWAHVIFGSGTLRWALWTQITQQYSSADGASPKAPEATAGNRGEIGLVKHIWLRPAQVRIVIRYARDLFLAGCRSEARELLTEYEAALRLAAADASSEDDAITFASLLNELGTQLYHLTGNLDYFGHPAGWVPKLSFESNFSGYEEAIKPAIDTLFLATWIERRWQSESDVARSLDHAIAALVTEVRSATSAMIEAQASLPALQSEIEEVTADLQQREVQLKSVHDELMKRAQDHVLQKHEIQFAVRILAAACQVVPVYQPAVGLAGKFATVLADVDSDQPWKTTGKLGKVLAEYMKVEFQSKSKQIVDDLKEKDSNRTEHKDAKDKAKKTEDKDAKDKAKKLSAQAEAWGPALADFNRALEGLKVPQEEVNAEVERLAIDDEGFKQVTRDIGKLSRKKAALFPALQSKIQAILTAYDTIVHGLQGVDAMRRQRDGVGDRLDPEVLSHASGMKRRAKERLLQYQYWMIKAYEYRLVEPCPHVDYQLDSILERAETLIDHPTEEIPGSQDGRPSLQAFQNLKTLYEEQQARIVSSIVQKLNESSRGLSSKRNYYELGEDELNDLNSRGSVVINLMEKGRLLPSWEDHRLTHIGIADSEGIAHTGTAEEVQLIFRHSGISSLRMGGQLYRFVSASPDYWSSKYVLRTGRIEDLSPTAASESLLNHFLGKARAPESEWLRYSRPSAWASVEITRELIGSRHDFRLTKLVLSFGLDQCLAPVNEKILEVRSPGRPLLRISCAPKDLNDREDGDGGFLRIFPAGRTVTLCAPQRRGSASFERWQGINLGEDRLYESLSSIPTLEVQMSHHWIVTPCYSGPGPSADLKSLVSGTLRRGR